MSRIIKILGTGCPKCKTTTKYVEEVIAENNLDATVIKVEDIMEIMEYNVMTTPALVVNETVVVKGRVPSKTEILELITSAKEIESTEESSGGCCSGDTTCC